MATWQDSKSIKTSMRENLGCVSFKMVIYLNGQLFYEKHSQNSNTAIRSQSRYATVMETVTALLLITQDNINWQTLSGNAHFSNNHGLSHTQHQEILMDANRKKNYASITYKNLISFLEAFSAFLPQLHYQHF